MRLAKAHAYIARDDAVGQALRRAARSHSTPDIVEALAFLRTRPKPLYKRVFNKPPDAVRLAQFLRLVGQRQVQDLAQLDRAWKLFGRHHYLEARASWAHDIAGREAPLSAVLDALAHIDPLFVQSKMSLAPVIEALCLYRGRAWFQDGWWVIAETLLMQDDSIRHARDYLRQITCTVLPTESNPARIARAVCVLREIHPANRAVTLALFRQTVGAQRRTSNQRLDTLRAIAQLPVATAVLIDSSMRSAHTGMPQETTEDKDRCSNVHKDMAILTKLVPSGQRIAPQRAVQAIDAYVNSPAAVRLSMVQVGEMGSVKTLAQLALRTMVSSRAAALATLSIVWSIIEARDLGAKTPTPEARADMRYAVVSALARCIKRRNGELVCANGQNQRIVAALFGHGFDLAGEADQLRATPAELVCVFTRELAREYNDQPPHEACLEQYHRAQREGARAFAPDAHNRAKFETTLKEAFRALDWPVPNET